MSDTLHKIIAGLLLAALVLGGGAAGYHFLFGEGAPQVVQLDKETLCPVDQPTQRHSVILVDTTDALSDGQRQLVRQVIDDFAAQALPFEKVSVFSIDAAAAYEPKRLFSACSPKRGEDADGFSEDPRRLEALWARDFGRPLDEAIAAEIAKGPQDSSPIIESVFAISLLYDFSTAVPFRRLVVVSDMLQNSPGLSLYKANAEYDSYAKSEHGELHRPDLRATEVTLHYVIRPAVLARQNAANREFWTRFFLAAGTTAEIRGAPK
jgi:hypothetical protein